MRGLKCILTDIALLFQIVSRLLATSKIITLGYKICLARRCFILGTQIQHAGGHKDHIKAGQLLTCTDVTDGMSIVSMCACVVPACVHTKE